jgi:hypothetical protein
MQEWLYRPRDIGWRFRTSLRPYLAVWLVGWFVGAVSLYESGRGAELTFHFHMTPRLRMCGAVPLFQSYAFMACTERTLSLTYIYFFAVLNKSHIELTTHTLRKQKLPDTKE